MTYIYNPLADIFQKNQDNFLNGILVNGVQHIYQNTKPIARPDGSALVVGDLWYNPSTGVKGFWNGTYWLETILRDSDHVFIEDGYNEDDNVFVITPPWGLFSTGIGVNINAKNILIKSVFHRVFRTSPGSWDEDNTYNIKTIISSQVISQFKPLSNPTSQGYPPVDINLLKNINGIGELSFDVQLTKIGSPGFPSGSVSFNYHHVL